MSAPIRFRFPLSPMPAGTMTSRKRDAFCSSRSIRLRLLVVALFFFVMLALLRQPKPASAHIEMKVPAARESKYGPWVKDTSLKNQDGSTINIDYSNTTPLGGSRTFPCAGKKPGPIVSTFAAGEHIPVILEGTATHDGGHCQFSISYDEGKTFVVLMTVYRECLRKSGNTYLVPIPTGIPSAKRAVFHWSWINAIGNREYYANCADIAIQGVSPGKLEGLQLLVVNNPDPIKDSIVLPEFPGEDTASCDGKLLLDSRPKVSLDVETGQANPNGVFKGKELEEKISKDCKVKYVGPAGGTEEGTPTTSLAKGTVTPTAQAQLSGASTRFEFNPGMLCLGLFVIIGQLLP